MSKPKPWFDMQGAWLAYRRGLRGLMPIAVRRLQLAFQAGWRAAKRDAERRPGHPIL